MKKILCLVIVIMLVLFCTGCGTRMETAENEPENSMFVKIEKVSSSGYFFNVVYHKETKVMYTISYHGVVTVMLDADGKPLLWEG